MMVHFRALQPVLKITGLHTVFRFLPLPVLVQLEHVEEDLARQAALATASIRREQWRGRLQWG